MMGGGDTSGLAGGSTKYFQINGSADLGATSNVDIRVPFNCIIDELRANIDNAAGAGESFTFTLMVEGVASSLTCAISGAADVEGNDLTNQVTVSEDDRICMRVVTTAGAAARRPLWSVKVLPTGD